MDKKLLTKSTTFMIILLFAPGELIKREELVSEVDLLVEELLHEELVESNLS